MPGLEGKLERKTDKKEKLERIAIPENEIEMSFSRSSGKGGQNVNKVSTKVTLKWNILETGILDLKQKNRIIEKLGNRIDKEGNLIIYSQEERSQYRNRGDAMDKINRLVSEALTVEEQRKPTKPTKASKIKRLEKKKQQSRKKEMRKKPDICE